MPQRLMTGLLGDVQLDSVSKQRPAFIVPHQILQPYAQFTWPRAVYAFKHAHIACYCLTNFAL